VSGHLHTPTAMPLGKIPQYPLGRRLGRPRASPYMVGKRKVPIITPVVQPID